MLKYILLAVLLLGSFPATAQDFPLRMQNAAYLATLKAVLDYKMNDEEVSEDLQRLRENAEFTEALRKKMESLTNTRRKNSTNKRIYQMLINDGEKIYNELN